MVLVRNDARGFTCFKIYSNVLTMAALIFVAVSQDPTKTSTATVCCYSAFRIEFNPNPNTLQYKEPNYSNIAQRHLESDYYPLSFL